MYKKVLWLLVPVMVLTGLLILPVAAQAQTGKAQLAFNVIVTAPPETTVGQSQRFQIQLSNVGSDTVTNIRFSSIAPTNWTVEFDPARLDSMSSGMSTMIVVSITPGAGTGHGSYDVSLMAQANETSTVTSMYLTVKGGISSWVWVGLVIAVLTCGLFIFIFMRFGRR